MTLYYIIHNRKEIVDYKNKLDDAILSIAKGQTPPGSVGSSIQHYYAVHAGNALDSAENIIKSTPIAECTWTEKTWDTGHTLWRQEFKNLNK